MASEGAGQCSPVAKSTGFGDGQTLAFTLANCFHAGSAWEVINLPVSLSVK